MASYQDIDSRLKVVEDKIDFVMKAFSVTKREGIIAPKMVTKNLLNIYRELKGMDAEMVEPIPFVTEQTTNADGSNL